MNKIDRIAVAFYKFWCVIGGAILHFVDKYGLLIAGVLLCYVTPIIISIIPFGIAFGCDIVKGTIASVVIVTAINIIGFLFIRGENIEKKRKYDRISG